VATFFTADTHFGHANIIKYEDRPFDSVEAMNDELVRRWNSVVSPEDRVIHLGDAVMGGFNNHAHNIGRLNGLKVLIPGNHDRCWRGMKNYQNHRDKYIDAGFGIVIDDDSEWASFEFGPGRIAALSHFPYEGDHKDEDRHPEFRPVDNGGWVVHGHVHGLWRVKGRQINVGVDVWNGLPVHEDVVRAIMDNPELAQDVQTEYETNGGWL
jgi:calcineurin-like phosphoesterase family protein